MRYKIFNAETGEPLGSVDDIRQAVLLADKVESMVDGLRAAIKDENTGVVL